MFNRIYLELNLLHKKFISKKKYFSFSGVDIILEKIFKHQSKGIYIDVGCQHPIKNNNTYCHNPCVGGSIPFSATKNPHLNKISMDKHTFF